MIGDVDQVLIADHEFAGQEIRASIAKIEAIDDRNDRRSKRSVGKHLSNQPDRLVTEQEDTRRIRAVIKQTAGFCNRLLKRDEVSLERNDRIPTGCAKYRECLRLSHDR